jgi:putative peptidoglycan lipid II flippase
MRSDLARVLLIAAFVQLGAFGKSVLIAYYFGVGAVLDGYYLAQATPALLAGIASGFLQTGFLTTYAGHVARGEIDEAAALLSRTLVVVALIGFAMSTALALLSPAIVELTAPGASTEVRSVATHALTILSFLLVLNVLADSMSLALNAHGAFAVAALAPAINIGIASVLLISFPSWGLDNLIWGTLIGLAAQAMVIAFEFRRRRIRFRSPLTANLGPSITAGAAILPGVAFANLSTFVPPILAARLGDGAVSAFSIAMRLHGAFTQVFVIAVSTVLLPHFSLAVGRGDIDSITKQLRTGLPFALLGSVLALSWVGISGSDLVALLFQRGAFDSEATATVSSVWFWLSIGLFPVIWGTVLAKVLQAQQLGGILSRLALLGLVLVAFFGWVLSVQMRLNGLALAVSIAFLATAAGCQWQVSRSLAPLVVAPRRAARRLVVATIPLGLCIIAMAAVDRALVDVSTEFRALVVSLIFTASAVLGFRAIGTFTRS